MKEIMITVRDESKRMPDYVVQQPVEQTEEVLYALNESIFSFGEQLGDIYSIEYMGGHTCHVYNMAREHLMTIETVVR